MPSQTSATNTDHRAGEDQNLLPKQQVDPAVSKIHRSSWSNAFFGVEEDEAEHQ